MITARFTALAATLSLVAASPAHAQSFAGDATGAVAPRATVGFNIPLGRSARARPSQLQLSFDRHRPGALPPLRGTEFGDRLPRETRFALSLDGTRTLSFNDRALSTPENRRNLSTGAAIAIGAGVVLVALLVAFAASDKVPDDFLDECC